MKPIKLRVGLRGKVKVIGHPAIPLTEGYEMVVPPRISLPFDLYYFRPISIILFRAVQTTPHEKGPDTMDCKVCSRKQTSRRKNLVREQLQDFASSTSLHGLGYVARRGITASEKIFWLVTFCISVGICLYQISNVWSKWEESPVIVSINEELIPVSKVPFPSVTICPQWKVFTNDYEYAKEKQKLKSGHKAKKLNVSNMSIEAINMFEDVSLICDKDKDIIEDQYFYLSNRNYSNVKVVENIKKVNDRHLHRLIKGTICSWQNKMNYVCSMLTKVYTQEGVCFNFNGMAAEDIFRQTEIQQDYSYIETQEMRTGWSMEDGYDGTKDPYPRRGRQNGADPDFVIVFLDSRKSLDKDCNSLYSGYKVYVHHPADMPQSSLYYYALPPEQTSSFAIKYSVVSTSQKLKHYSPEIRRCYFTGERYLRYFQIYTESNCRMECLSNYTFSMCGCVGFYMPHHTSDRICTIQSTACMETSLENMAEKETPDILLNPTRCNCLPLCNDIEYDAEISKAEFNMKQIYIDMNAANSRIVDMLVNYSYSRMEMFFKSPRFVAMRRSELFGTTDFIANCGGLLGLFLGFSFLSLVEIIYFMSLRLWCGTVKKDLDEENETK